MHSGASKRCVAVPRCTSESVNRYYFLCNQRDVSMPVWEVRKMFEVVRHGVSTVSYCRASQGRVLTSRICLAAASAPNLAREFQSTSFEMQTSNVTALKALPSHEAMYPHGLISLAVPSKRMPNMIQSLGTTSIQEFQESKFVRPQSVFYELDGHQKRWYAALTSSISPLAM
jgi:hypothetical protein